MPHVWQLWPSTVVRASPPTSKEPPDLHIRTAVNDRDPQPRGLSVARVITADVVMATGLCAPVKRPGRGATMMTKRPGSRSFVGGYPQQRSFLTCGDGLGRSPADTPQPPGSAGGIFQPTPALLVRSCPPARRTSKRSGSLVGLGLLVPPLSSSRGTISVCSTGMAWRQTASSALFRSCFGTSSARSRSMAWAEMRRRTCAGRARRSGDLRGQVIPPAVG